MALPGLFPDALKNSAAWAAAVSGYLHIMLAQGMRAALPTSRPACRSD
jgi:hypothetical protein